MMKRSRAFVLVELLTTMLLQAGFILVMCSSFYLLASFYSKSQQMLTARDHADRVILFFDDKMIHTGLGLWKCSDSSEVRGTLDTFTYPQNDSNNKLLRSIRLPVVITSDKFEHNTGNNNRYKLQKAYKVNEGTPNEHTIHYGSCVTLLYAERDLSSGRDGNILATRDTALINTGNITMLDTVNGRNNYTNSEFYNTTAHNNKSDGVENISNWAVMEGAGVPFFIRDNDLLAQGWGIADNQTIPAGGELLYLRCIQMFVQGKTTDEKGRQLAFREPSSNTRWGNTYNQEEGVLEIYMELDTSTNIFTLWVMGTGGYDQTIDTPRPATWPENAHPTPSEWTSTTGTYKDYKHNIVYVSRASWKLNNIPDGFKWN